MKHIFSLVFVVVLFGASAQSLVNTHCSAAERLCPQKEETSLFQRFNKEESGCFNNNTRLYYSFQSNVTGNYEMLTYTTESNNSTFKLYGPYVNLENACGEIDQLSAIPIVSSTSSAISQSVTSTVVTNQFYILEVLIESCEGSITMNAPLNMIRCSNDINCEDCIGSFQPSSGKYIISAWVKEANSSNSTTNYSNAKIGVDAGSGYTWFFPSGQIIDGWQRIEGEFNANTIGAISLQLKAISTNVYFDDIRIFPYDGTMISYVYDPLTLRLVAELDERNYAKFYEYDEEGKLIRVKKETEKGIMTIQENRDNSSGL